ncbi:PhzF family phenazine biosynthesis protein [Chitinophaga silvatica]|uniref:PhzF family phenazine biosynthesis protein n=1 Tax=Chitinophaga silvatica TaxID=2282649 RepID=A0A3E1YDP8_9BACT|nr:PhzF family phenazine biosynthesis protein [Chitinophaga silvatica]RFS24730.1 PhzF family phenazine biosynthesis protein [Chitinophaga silvatica]
MSYKIYQVDAFADKIFKGNPAAVCPLPNWLDDNIMQKIAKENNLAETAFYIKKGNRYEIRWFTPEVEVDLCGHATLASAYVLFHLEGHDSNQINFYSPRSGELPVTKHGEIIMLNFPADTLEEITTPPELLAAFEVKPIAAFKGKTDIMLIFDKEEDIKKMKPSLEEIKKLPVRGVIITARGTNTDFVSRFFGPAVGVDEDPVTGSAHTSLVPYWAKQLHKESFTAIQLSERTGVLTCKLLGDRVEIGGQAKLYLRGEIYF